MEAASNEDNRLDEPIPQSDGTSCYTKNCSRHKIVVLEIQASSREEAKQILKDNGYIGKEIQNKVMTELKTKISGDGLRKLTQSHVTKQKLVPKGYTIKEAEEIHMTTVANLPKLFEEATDFDKQPSYHGRGRDTVTHLTTSFFLPKYKEAFIADMSLIQFTDKNIGDKLYALNIDEIAPVEYARMQ